MIERQVMSLLEVPLVPDKKRLIVDVGFVDLKTIDVSMLNRAKLKKVIRNLFQDSWPQIIFQRNIHYLNFKIDAVILREIQKIHHSTIEHSENKIITNFESWVGPGVIQFIIQQTSPCKYKQRGENNRNVISILRCVPLVFLLQACLLKARVEYSKSNLVSKQHILRKNFTFGILYCILKSVAYFIS